MEWNEYFFRHVYLAARKSKDPSSQVGAILVKNQTVISEGYNGFPRGVEDSEERLKNRNIKYELVVHGETNCIFNAARNGISTLDSILYVPGTPCCNCCKSVIQAGISKVVIHKSYNKIWWENCKRAGQSESWADKSKWSNTMFEEAGVKIEEYDKYLGVKLLLNEQIIKV